MNNKIKALVQIALAGLLGAGIMIGLKIISPEYGEQIFWVVWFCLFMYFAYTYKVAALELEDFLNSIKKEK